MAKGLTATEEVTAYLTALEHPLKKEIEEVRKVILNANANLTEHIKWNAPSYRFNGDDRITFNLAGKGFFRLIFHCGAKATEKKPKDKLFEDKTGLLEWAANDRAVAKFTDMHDVKAKKNALIKTIDTWLKVTTITNK